MNRAKINLKNITIGIRNLLAEISFLLHHSLTIGVNNTVIAAFAKNPEHIPKMIQTLNKFILAQNHPFPLPKTYLEINANKVDLCNGSTQIIKKITVNIANCYQ